MYIVLSIRVKHSVSHHHKLLMDFPSTEVWRLEAENKELKVTGDGQGICRDVGGTLDVALFSKMMC